MTDQRPSSYKNGKLENLNRQVIEFKKKINLSEGQRKANFEECDVKKRENAERLSQLKKEVKELRVEFARAKNSDDSAEHALQLSRKSSAYVKKRNLTEAIETIDEDIVRYRRELDLNKYRLQKKQNKLGMLLREYEELVDVDTQKTMRKSTELPLKKQIVRLENRLLRVNVMQMEADIVCKKYKNVHANLKKDAEVFASWLEKLADDIKEQNIEIQRLRKIKDEAVTLKNSTRLELMKQEEDSVIIKQQQESVIQDYRKQVEERKIEVESLERMVPLMNRHLAVYDEDDENIDPNNLPQNKVSELEKIFMKLRNATGVTKTENVLQRFLNQKATKERLKVMQESAEKEKMELEKTRQQLTAEIEMRKFSESKDANQNAEKLEMLNTQISEQVKRKSDAEIKKLKCEELVSEMTRRFKNLCRICTDMNETCMFDEYANTDDPDKLLWLLSNGIRHFFSDYGNLEKAIDMTNDSGSKKLEVSIETSSNVDTLQNDERPLFPTFPLLTPPGVQQPSEDEDEIPSRNYLKRQAQLLVDTKSRRKMFNLKR